MRLSIGMMVKNETCNLERCLQSLQPLREAVQAELIIVDTGSEDDTVEIAKKYTDKVYFHSWKNNFSEMRNITIGYATGEWFLVIDADEELQDTKSIIDFLKSSARKNYGAVAMTCYNFTKTNDPNQYTILTTLRLFKNDGYFHYEGAVHNQQVFKGEAIEIPASLNHYGYIADDQELMDKKFNRTCAILKKELEKNPKNIYYWYQLSATYAMHKDVEEAIESIEKAYQLLYKQPDPANCMFVFTHRALIYKMVGKYKQVEENCLESLTVKTGYIDIYYHLAESQAVLGKCQEAVDNYNQYLSMVAGYNKMESRDTSIIEYTLNESQVAYSNLVNLHYQLGNYEQVLQCAEKLTRETLIKETIGHVVHAYIQLEKIQNLREYYSSIVKEEWRSLFYEKLSVAVTQATSHKIAAAFCDIHDEYGLYSRMLLEDEQGVFSNETLEEIGNIDFSTLPLYCSGIVYYLLKRRYPLEKLLMNFKEIWLNYIFEKLAKDYEDLTEKVYEYLQGFKPENNLHEFKLSKALCRYALLLDKLDTQQYEKVFNRYCKDGIAYIQKLYNTDIIDNGMVYEVKNDEEVFLVYMYHAKIYKGVSPARYFSSLRKALEALPTMKKGIEILLNELQDKDMGKKDEFEAYKIKIKNSIRNLIENNELDCAKSIIAEYKCIVANDIEIILLESNLLLKMTGTNSSLN